MVGEQIKVKAFHHCVNRIDNAFNVVLLLKQIEEKQLNMNVENVCVTFANSTMMGTFISVT